MTEQEFNEMVAANAAKMAQVMAEREASAARTNAMREAATAAYPVDYKAPVTQTTRKR